MRFGLVTMDPRWLEAELSILDASGFESLYLVDHPTFPTPDPWSWLAFAAARSERIRLGTHVTGAPFHHPTALARMVAAVDVLSSGRAVLGIGTGYERADFEPYGFERLPMKARFQALGESLSILKSLWTQETTEFDGTYFRLVGGAGFAPKPVQNPHPPLIVGLNRQGALLDVAARWADGVNTWQLGVDQVSALRPHVEDACARVGRSSDALEITADVLLARGADAAGAQRLAQSLRDAARSWGRSELVTDWDGGGVLFGDADGVAEQALRFREAGVTELSVVVGGVDDLRWFDECVIEKLGND